VLVSYGQLLYKPHMYIEWSELFMMVD